MGYVGTGNILSDGLIKEQARRLLHDVNSQLTPAQQIDIKFSNGWLHRFKQGNDFKMYRSHREDGDADEQAIQLQLPGLCSRLSNYSLRDKFNADEFGLYYSLPPTQTIGPGRLPGKKKIKHRATVLACSNADGSEKLVPLVISHALHFRCFGGRDVAGKGSCIEAHRNMNESVLIF